MLRDILLGVLLTLVVGILTFLFMDRKKSKIGEYESTNSIPNTTNQNSKKTIVQKPATPSKTNTSIDMQRKPHIIALVDRGRILAGKSAVVTVWNLKTF